MLNEFDQSLTFNNFTYFQAILDMKYKCIGAPYPITEAHFCHLFHILFTISAYISVYGWDFYVTTY